MYAWVVMVKRCEKSLIVGFSFGRDMGCYGRLRYRWDKRRMELLRMPRQQVPPGELKNFVVKLQSAIRNNSIPWQKTCVKYRSMEDVDEFGRMMDKIYA